MKIPKTAKTSQKFKKNKEQKMVTQNEINSQQRDMNGFIKILPLNKNDAKERDLLEAFKSFDKILKSDSQKQNISFNKYFYNVVTTEKNHLISGKTPVNSVQEINGYMIGLRKEILDNADKFTKQLQQAKNDRERVFIVQPKNAKQQAIEDTFQGFYHNCVKPYREMNGKQLSSDFYQKWQETKNYMVSNEVPMPNVEKYLNNTLNQLKQGAYDKVENYSNKDYARSNNSNQWSNKQQGWGNKQERKQNSQWNNNGYQQWNKEKKQDNAQQDNQWEQKSYKKSYGQTQQQGWNANTGYGNNANNSNNYNSVNEVNNYNTQQSNQQQSGYQKKSNSYGNYNQDNQQQQENYNQGYQKKNNDYNKGQNQSSGYSSSNSYNEQQDEVKTQKNTNYNNLKQKPYKRK